MGRLTEFFSFNHFVCSAFEVRYEPTKQRVKKRNMQNVNTEQHILSLCIVQPAGVAGFVLVVIGLDTSLTVLAEFDCEFRDTELVSLA